MVLRVVFSALILLSATVYGQQKSVSGEWSKDGKTVFGSLSQSPQGTSGMVGLKGNVFNENGHSLDVNTRIGQTFAPKGPTSIGGGIDYQGPRVGAGLDVNHINNYGTNVGVHGNANVWRSNNGRSSLDANANYNRQFGGPFGAGRPNYGAGLNFIHRF